LWNLPNDGKKATNKDQKNYSNSQVLFEANPKEISAGNQKKKIILVNKQNLAGNSAKLRQKNEDSQSVQIRQFTGHNNPKENQAKIKD
jgi:hypothetical protein